MLTNLIYCYRTCCRPWSGLLKRAAVYSGEMSSPDRQRQSSQSGLTNPRRPPSGWNDDGTAGSLGAFPFIVCLRHWSCVGISEIVYADPIGFPGGYGSDRGNDRYAEGDR